MAETTQETGYLSIGEVLGLLLEDFPDVTISKIRFLESQGLISPERTSSGYRKFYDADVELLRVILTEQRSNYLPLRVIKDRLETGEIDPTGEHHRPDDDDEAGHDDHDDHDDHTDVPSSSVAAHPAARQSAAPTDSSATTASSSEPSPERSPERSEGPTADRPTAAADPVPTATPTPEPEPEARLMPGVLLDRAELCAMVGMTPAELEQLEGFGIVVARDGSSPALFGDDAVEIAKPACEFLRAGVDARHLRNWRTSAEREASLYEQLVTPRFRQRNPESHAEALAQLKRLDALGGSLRSAMTRQALRRHFES
jgi:DNA-binding transcriptional MerR regulator